MAVRRLRAAGATIVGKTVLYELAFGAQNDRWPPTRNPLDPTRSTGGSSSGSAAAVAAYLCFGSLGTDMGHPCSLDAYRTGTLVDAQLARIARVDPELRCYAEVFASEALEQAARLDRRRGAGVLAGVPIAIKDNIDVAGHQTWVGARSGGPVRSRGGQANLWADTDRRADSTKSTRSHRADRPDRW